MLNKRKIRVFWRNDGDKLILILIVLLLAGLARN